MESDLDEEDEEEEEEGDDFDDESAKMSSSRIKAAPQKARAGLSDEDDEEEYEEGEDDAPSGGWGPNKQSYYSTNDLEDMSSDSEMGEDEKREMELREVKKLQSKSRQGLVDEDFGLGQDAIKLDGSTAAREARKKELNLEADAAASGIEPLNVASLDAVQRAELMSKVQRTTPETLALVGEYADIVDEIAIVSNRLKEVTERGVKQEIVGLCCLHHQTLLTYAANLSFYFYLRASPVYVQNPQKLASHGVIGRLLKLKTGLQLLDGFGFAAEGDSDSEDEVSIEEDGDEENRAPKPSFLFKGSLLDASDDDGDSESLGSLEKDELMQLDSEERESEAVEKKGKKVDDRKSRGKEKTSKPKKRKANKVTPASAPPLAHVAGLQDEEDSLGEMKKRRKEASAAPKLSTDAEAFNAFGEPVQLNASDSADKEARRRSLKFYTGQIDAKDARKAGGSGLGGDSDIPYRDRERSRQAVANTIARKASRNDGLVDRGLDGDDWGEEDSRDWKDVMDIERPDLQSKGSEAAADDSLDYYDLVASGKKAAKRARKEEYDEIQANQRVAPEDGLEEGEHRGINRTIEKNKGLTPRRPKSVRNPRVKKRLRYEAAKKKLSSKGPVYKGGQGALQGGYSGEKSGINSNVVKSRQFA